MPVTVTLGLQATGQIEIEKRSRVLYLEQMGKEREVKTRKSVGEDGSEGKMLRDMDNNRRRCNLQGCRAAQYPSSLVVLIIMRNNNGEFQASSLLHRGFGQPSRTHSTARYVSYTGARRSPVWAPYGTVRLPLLGEFWKPSPAVSAPDDVTVYYL